MRIGLPVIVSDDPVSTTEPFVEVTATSEPSSSGNGFASSEDDDLAVERFRESMRITGGRFAEMTPSEAAKIVRFLQGHIGSISRTARRT